MEQEHGVVEKLEFKVEPAVQEAIAKFEEERRHKSFSQRHPELGKMINCPVCNRRHRDSIKCEQKYAYLYTLEDTETGEKTKVFATATPHGERPTYRQILGAAMFKGKRRKPHANHRNLQLVQRVIALYGDAEFNPESKEDQAKIKMIRATAARQLRKERTARLSRSRSQQKLSRRINLGLASNGLRI